jgi:four helix bundle protein
MMMTNHNYPNRTFHAFEVALELVRAVRPLLERIERRDRNLGHQLRDAVASVPGNLAEGSRRSGQDRPYHFRVAMGSADETRSHLRVAAAFGYVGERDIQPVLELADRVIAMAYRLASPRR